MNHLRHRRAAWVLLTLCVPMWGIWSATAHAQIGIGVSITVAPPALPVYVQPAIPAPGYLWTPGYWAWDGGDYYWVPGTWVEAPQAGFLWTPGYWGWGDGVYAWHAGYWGPHIGFYGGVNYGFGYGGSGYEGGYWDHDHFFYNRSVNNIQGNTQITNVYNKTVVNNVSTTRVSFNGGQGGTTAQPTASERAAASERHLPPVQAQVQHEQVARSTPELRAAANHGKPPITATARAGEFKATRGAGTPPAQRASAPPPSHPTASTPPAASPPHSPPQRLATRPATAPPAAHTPAASPPHAPPQRLATRPATAPPAAHTPAASPPTHRPPAAPGPAPHPAERGGEHDR